MTHFEILQTCKYQHRVLVKTNDKIDFISEVFDSRTACIQIINKIRKNAQRHDTYKMIELECGSWLFQLYDISTNLLLGHSASQLSRKDLEEKIEETRIVTPFATFNSNIYLSITIQ